MTSRENYPLMNKEKMGEAATCLISLTPGIFLAIKKYRTAMAAMRYSRFIQRKNWLEPDNFKNLVGRPRKTIRGLKPLDSLVLN